MPPNDGTKIHKRKAPTTSQLVLKQIKLLDKVKETQHVHPSSEAHTKTINGT